MLGFQFSWPMFQFPKGTLRYQTRLAWLVFLDHDFHPHLILAEQPFELLRSLPPARPDPRHKPTHAQLSNESRFRKMAHPRLPHGMDRKHTFDFHGHKFLDLCFLADFLSSFSFVHFIVV